MDVVWTIIIGLGIALNVLGQIFGSNNNWGE